LPEEYKEELRKRLKTAEENIQLIHSDNLNDEQKNLLQKFLDFNFRESLNLTNEQRQLDHLTMLSQYGTTATTAGGGGSSASSINSKIN
jgi:hypothetical protein